MIFKVTQEHIKAGIMADCDLCPVALAINAQLHGLFVGAEVIYHNEELKDIVKHSPEVSRWIRDFDSTFEVKPMEFHLSAEVFMS